MNSKLKTNPLFRAINNMDHGVNDIKVSTNIKSPTDRHVDVIQKELLSGKPGNKSNKLHKSINKPVNLKNEKSSKVPTGPLSYSKDKDKVFTAKFNEQKIKVREFPRHGANSSGQINSGKISTSNATGPNMSDGQRLSHRISPLVTNEKRVYSIKHASLPPIVVIRNLADGTSTEDVSSVLNNIGPIEDCRCAKLEGVVMAEVTFIDSNHAAQAAANFNGAYADGHRLDAYITKIHKIADPVKNDKVTFNGQQQHSGNINRKKRGILRQ